MKKGSLNILETHVEKAVLGLAGAFMLAMVVLFLIRSPNSVRYDGQDVGPGELDAAIMRSAEDLQAKVARAQDKGGDTPAYSTMLAQQHKSGILDAAAKAVAPVPRNLRLAAAFGQPIVVPGLEEDTEVGNIELVTPLRPSPPKLITGRSLAVRTQATLGEVAPSTEDDDEIDAGEFPWVSVAAYVNKQAQQDDMTTAGYAPYRSKVYVTGIDLQRQEMLASGEFSDWVDVARSKAIPKVDIKDPLFDDETGGIINKDEIGRAYKLVKDMQPQLIQPSFYDVSEGDFWEIPPLEGYEPEEEEEEEDEPRAKRDREPVRQQRTPPRGRGAPRGGGGRGLAGGGRGLAGGGRGMPGGAMAPPSGGRMSPGRSDSSQNEAREKAENRREAKKNLSEAYKAYRQKDYNGARDLINRVINNDDAVRSDVSKAEKLLRAVEKRMAQESGAGMPRAGSMRGVAGGGRIAGGGRMAGPRGMMGTPTPSASVESVGIVAHPEDPQQPAVWSHDDQVESGKTYRYRMRVRLWNRYVGRMKALRNPENAKHAELVGEWSLPSEPITVTPSTYFFVKGPRSEVVASIEVWKWRKGEWIRETFNVQVGDVIGGIRQVEIDEWDENDRQVRTDVDFTTGAIVLDLRINDPVKLRLPKPQGGFRHSESESLTMVYLDPADGQVKEKVQAFDRYDPIRTKLKDQEF